MAGSLIHVDLKLRITTCGSHNGIIIHSGVQHSKQSPSTVWPYTAYSSTTLPPVIQFPVTPLPIQNAPAPITITDIQEDRSSKKQLTPPPSSPVFSFGLPDSPPDEFIEPNKVKLNVFRVGKTESLLFPDYSSDDFCKEQASTLMVDDIPEKYGLNHMVKYRCSDVEEIEKVNEDERATRWAHDKMDANLDAPACSNSYSYAASVQKHKKLLLDGESSPSVNAKNYRLSPYIGKQQYSLSSTQNNSGAQMWNGKAALYQQQTLPLTFSRTRNSHCHHNDRANSKKDYCTERNIPLAHKIPKEETSEELFHLYQTRDAAGNIRYQCKEAFTENDVGIELIKLDENSIPMMQTSGNTGMSETTEWQKTMNAMLSPAYLPSYDQIVPCLKSNSAVSPYVESGSFIEKKQNVDPQKTDTETIPEDKKTDCKVLSHSFTPNERFKPQQVKEVINDNAYAKIDDGHSGISMDQKNLHASAASLSTTTIDSITIPSKPILHCFRRPSRKGLRNQKSVRFPLLEPKVVVDEHRLVVTELGMTEEGSK